MDIELGDLREPIAPLCNAKKDTWNGLTRIHLKRPEIDWNALLEGSRIFALELDKETTVAKISRGFDNIASNDDLTLKVTSKSLPSIPSHKLFEMIVRDSFSRNKEFEITQVLKGVDSDHAYIVASSPDQCNKILRSLLAIESELIAPTPIREKLSTSDIARKTAWF
jgi:cellulose biosynthesis protein BcsQ